MDIEIPEGERDDCVCLRGKAGVSGRCALCHAEGAQAFWDYINQKITYPGFIRRLRKKK